jgi:hypothetical protein
VPNWSRLDKKARVATGKSVKKPFLCSLQFTCTNSIIFLYNFFINFDNIM